MTEAPLRVPDAFDRKDLATFLTRAARLDESAVVRLRLRDDGRIVVWTATQFDVLACRAVRGELRTPDITAAVDEVLRGLQAPDADGYVHTGFPMDSVGGVRCPPIADLSIWTTFRHGQCSNWRSAGESWHANTAVPTVHRCRCWTNPS